MSRVFNFSAGPCTLPLEVLEEAQREFVEYQDTGMSIIEMSHRTPPYERVHFEAMELAREISGAPDDFEVLFIQGGATLQFAMVPLNLLGGGGTGAYAVTGAWAQRALEDGRYHGDVYSAWDGEPTGFTRTPSSQELELASDTRYLHITSNETINGIRYPTWPEADVPLVADVSSEFLSRPLPWDRFSVVYGGIQKNLGPSGLALVFVRRSAIGEAPQLSAYLSYSTHADSDSMFNTPPIFQIYLMGKVLRWIKSQGGVPGIENASEYKAGLVYDAIDQSEGFYRSPVSEESRSVTNVVFRLPTEELEARFLADAETRGMVSLKGHRKVGGCRASLYAAIPTEGVEALAEFMGEFRSTR
ncbi:MAG: 3-phosphoserine/phosphohydroxythreonine transaminase [Acidimicrobiia bacterium]